MSRKSATTGSGLGLESQCEATGEIADLRQVADILVANFDSENSALLTENDHTRAYQAIWAGCEVGSLLTRPRKTQVAKHLKRLAANSPMESVWGLVTAESLETAISSVDSRVLFDAVAEGEPDPNSEEFMASVLLLAMWPKLKSVLKTQAGITNLLEDVADYNFERIEGQVVCSFLAYFPTMIAQQEAIAETMKNDTQDKRVLAWKSFIGSLASPPESA